MVLERLCDIVAIGLIAGAAGLGGGFTACGFVAPPTTGHLLAAAALLVGAIALTTSNAEGSSVERSVSSSSGFQSVAAIALVVSTLVVILPPDAYWLVTALFVTSMCTVVLRTPPISHVPIHPAAIGPADRYNEQVVATDRPASSRPYATSSLWILLVVADLIAMVVVLGATRTFQSGNPSDWTNTDDLLAYSQTNPAWISVLGFGFLLATLPRLALFPTQAWIFDNVADSILRHARLPDVSSVRSSSCLCGGLLPLSGIALLVPVFSWLDGWPEIRSLIVGLSALSIVTAASCALVRSGSAGALAGIGAASFGAWLASAASGLKLTDAIWVLPVLAPIIAVVLAGSGCVEDHGPTKELAVPKGVAPPQRTGPSTHWRSAVVFCLIVAGLAVANVPLLWMESPVDPTLSNGSAALSVRESSIADAQSGLAADGETFTEEAPMNHPPFAGLLAFGAVLSGLAAVGIAFSRQLPVRRIDRPLLTGAAIVVGGFVAVMQFCRMGLPLNRVVEIYPWTIANSPGRFSGVGLVCGIAIGFMLRGLPNGTRTRLTDAAKPVARLARNHFGVPDAVSLGVMLPVRALAQLTRFFDWFLVDLLVASGVPRVARGLGECFRRLLHGDWVLYAGAALLGLSAWLWLLV